MNAPTTAAPGLSSPIEEIDESQLREFADPVSTRKAIFDRTLKAFESKFPMENGDMRLEVSNLRYDPKKMNYGISATKDALLHGKRLNTPLYGDVRLTNISTGEVLDQKPGHLLANVPYLTDRGTFVHDGTEYVTVNQTRLRPGIYTRKRENGEMEAHINVRPGTGMGLRMYMEPETGIFRVRAGASQIKLYPILSRLGVSDDQLAAAWGPSVLEANRAAGDPKAFGKFYDKLVGSRADRFLERLRKNEADEAAEDGFSDDDSEQKEASFGPDDFNEEKQAFFDAFTTAMARYNPDQEEFAAAMLAQGFKPVGSGDEVGYERIKRAMRIITFDDHEKTAGQTLQMMGTGAALGGLGGALLSAVQEMRANSRADRRWANGEDPRKEKVDWAKNMLLGAAVGGGIGLSRSLREGSPVKPKDEMTLIPGDMTVTPSTPPEASAPAPKPAPAPPLGHSKPSQAAKGEVPISSLSTATRKPEDLARNQAIADNPDLRDRPTIAPAVPADGSRPTTIGPVGHRFEHIGSYRPDQFKGNYGDKLDVEIAKAKAYAANNDLGYDYDLLKKPVPVFRRRAGSNSIVGSQSVTDIYGAGPFRTVKNEILLDTDMDGNPTDEYATGLNDPMPLTAMEEKTNVESPIDWFGNAQEEYKKPFRDKIPTADQALTGGDIKSAPNETLDHELTHSWTSPGLMVTDPKKLLPGSGGLSSHRERLVSGDTHDHGAKPAEGIGWMSRLQHHLFKDQGGRLETPTEALQFLRNKVEIQDDGEFEKSLNGMPWDVRRLFRHLRNMKDDPSVSADEYTRYLRFLSHHAPALVQEFDPNDMEAIGKTASFEDEFVWGQDPLVDFLFSGLQKEADVVVPGRKDSFAFDRDALRAQRARVNTNVSEATKRSGNYRKGHVRINGLDISIENPKGSYRRGVSRDGKAWQTKMKDDYGYVKGTRGKDGDHIDVFLGPELDSEMVFIVDQRDKGGKTFDEHKCMLGFRNREAAKAAYLANYDDEWDGFMAITPLTFDQFRWWCYNGDTSKPMKDQQTAKIASDYQGWIGVDLDGTLAVHEGAFDPTYVGDPIPSMLKFVQWLIQSGETVKIMTARASDQDHIPVVEDWLEKNGLAGVEVTNIKDPGMKMLIDDRAVRAGKNQGLSLEDEQMVKSELKLAAAKCPGCNREFPEGEPLPDVDMCEVCERYGCPKEKTAMLSYPGEDQLKDLISRVRQEMQKEASAADLLGPESEEDPYVDHGALIEELTLKVAMELGGFDEELHPKVKPINEREKAALVMEQLTRMEIDPEISERNLGRPYANLGVEPLVDTAAKLLRINRGEDDQDDRDNKANQTFHSVDDFIEERIKKDAGQIGRTLMYRTRYNGSLKSFRPGLFTPQIEGLIVSNSLSQAVPGVNPVELYDIRQKVTQVGEGGIGSKDSIPLEARDVHPSQLGVIDPIRTAESGMVGIDQRFSAFARKGPNNQLYFPLIDRRTGKRVWRTPSQIYGKKVLFPRNASA